MQVDLSKALSAADEVERAGGQALIRGATGSGVHSLAEKLRARERWVVLELRESVHVDATPALMLELLSHLPSADRAQLTDLGATDAPMRLVDAFNSANKCLALIVPPGLESLGDEAALRAQRLRSLLRSFSRLRAIMLLGNASAAPETLGLNPSTVVELAFPQRPVSALTFPPGAFAEAATQLASLMNAMEASPLVWRLAIGLLWLGAPAQAVAGLCQRSPGEAINGLAAELGIRIKQNPALFGAVQQLLALRRSISATSLKALTRVSDQALPLLTHCIGYNDPVRTSLTVRDALRRELGFDRLSEPAHVTFAAHYKQLDGVSSPYQTTSPEQMTAWIERAHHLAHAGTAEWTTLDHPAPELYWERAIYLSVERGEYVKAAEIYEACVSRFPTDDYATHYAGWNRWLAGQHTRAVCEQLARAVELAPRHTWWNSRYISSLIDLGDFTEARKAWGRALLNIDPDGARSRSSEAMLKELYLQVADAWLRKDCWHDAQRTLGRLPEVFKSSRELQETLARITNVRARVWAQLWAWVQQKSGPQWTRAIRLLESLEARKALPVPALTEGEDGALTLTWSFDDALVTIELSGESEVYWYAADRVQRTSVDGTCSETAFSNELDGWLLRVSHA